MAAITRRRPDGGAQRRRTVEGLHVCHDWDTRRPRTNRAGAGRNRVRRVYGTNDTGTYKKILSKKLELHL